jgi:hypothetical protein
MTATAQSPARRNGASRFDQHPIYEDITPARAQEYLDASSGNRTIRQFKVDLFAEDMANGRWTEKGSDLIRFDTSGALRDGHHRLLACVKSGRPFPAFVLRDCTDDDIINVDTGTSRSAADAVRLDGYANANDLAVALRLLLGLRNHPGRSFASRRYQNREVVAMLESDPGIVEYVPGSVEISRGVPSVTTGTVIALRYLFAKVDGEDSERFFDILSKGYGLEPGDPVLALRNILMNNATSSRKRRREEIIALIIIAFNKWRDGERSQILRWGSNQEFPTLPGVTF